MLVACTMTTCVVLAGNVRRRPASFVAVALGVVPAVLRVFVGAALGGWVPAAPLEGGTEAAGETAAGRSTGAIADSVVEGSAADCSWGFLPQPLSASNSARTARTVRGARRLRWSTGTTHSICAMPARFPAFAVIAFLLVAALAAVAGCGGSAGRPAAAATSGPVPSGGGLPGAGTGGATPAVVPAEDSVEPLPAALRQAMTGVSWRAGCPVGLDDLRLLHLSYVDFAGAGQRGQLVVHKDIADAVVRVFGKLRAARFPIRGMVLIEAYGGSDDASMAADNTSGFNCRNVPNTTHWSNHAYGRAVDVNTVENPYLPGKQIMPPAGKEYLDRRNVRPGMIVDGDVVVRAFKAEGFTWGGAWTSGIDYQHFEKPR
jgi:hypothetical protein